MHAETTKNPKLLCAFHALQMSLLPMAILAPFYKREIDMTQQDIYVLQAIFGLFGAEVKPTLTCQISITQLKAASRAGVLENGKISEQLKRAGLKPETRFRPDD